MKLLMLLAGLLITSCAARPMMWVKDNTTEQKTAAALHACRMEANQGGQKVFSAMELEGPCMSAKGYRLEPMPYHWEIYNLDGTLKDNQKK